MKEVGVDSSRPPLLSDSLGCKKCTSWENTRLSYLLCDAWRKQIQERDMENKLLLFSEEARKMSLAKSLRSWPSPHPYTSE